MCVCVRERESERERRRENMSGPSRIGKLYRDFKKWGEGQNFSLGHFYKRLLGFFFSHLVKYYHLDRVGAIPQVTKTFFPSGKFGLAFLKGKEGRKKGREDRRERSNTYSIL